MAELLEFNYIIVVGPRDEKSKLVSIAEIEIVIKLECLYKFNDMRNNYK